MNDNNDKVNREIEKIFSQASMNKLYENVDETSQFIKQYSGIIIASGFSMLIFRKNRYRGSKRIPYYS